MTQILDLPVETLQEIVQYVTLGYRSNDDLKALCLTSKALCYVAQRKLYHKFIYNHGNYWREGNIGQRLLNFADTVARKPDLRKNVKSLEVELCSHDGLVETRGSFVPPGFELGGLRSAAPQYFGSNQLRRMWESGAFLRDFPHVEAILSFLPQLEVLRLTVGLHIPQDRAYTGLGVESAPYLANLKELALFGATGSRGSSGLTRFEMIMPLIASLPHLRKLELEHFDIAGVFRKRQDREDFQWRIEARSLGIEDLSIRRCSMTNDTLQRIVQSCRRLTRFDYKPWDDSEFEKRRKLWRQALDTESLHAALLLHKDSLEELCLDCVNPFERMEDHRHARTLPPYPSFQEFLRLRTFKIEYRRMRYENLPPNITYLYLYDCRDVRDEAEVEAWKAIKRSACPDIERFEIMCTENGVSINHMLKYMYFKMGNWCEKTRKWEKDGFLLKVWAKDLIDGTYHYSQGTYDTGEIDSNGDKIRDEDEDYDSDEEDEDDDADEDVVDVANEGGDDKYGSESKSRSLNTVKDEDHHMNSDESVAEPSKELLEKFLDEDPGLEVLASHSNHTADETAGGSDPMDVDDDEAQPVPSTGSLAWLDEMITEAQDEDVQSVRSTGSLAWLNEMISEAEDEEKITYPPDAAEIRALLRREVPDEDDGWRGGIWEAPWPSKVRKEKQKWRKRRREPKGIPIANY